jgi:hypothetical protein
MLISKISVEKPYYTLELVAGCEAGDLSDDRPLLMAYDEFFVLSSETKTFPISVWAYIRLKGLKSADDRPA